MKIYIDIDGTIIEPSYGKLGRVNFGCFEVIKKLQDAGHEIWINTSFEGEKLESALNLINEQSWMFFKNRRTEELEIQPILNICKEKIQPWDWDWEEMIKHDQMFIDDYSRGIPLKKCCMFEGNMVDWNELDKQFIEHNLY